MKNKGFCLEDRVDKSVRNQNAPLFKDVVIIDQEKEKKHIQRNTKVISNSMHPVWEYRAVWCLLLS